MAVPAPALARGIRAARELANRVERRPLDRIRWMRPQHRFLSSTHKVRLYRAGNQSLGKTTAGLAEGLYRAEGEHPYKWVPPPPTEGWIVCASWDQSLAIQKKLWNLADKSQLHPDQKPFSDSHGFGTHNPSMRFKNGSVIRIKTAKQGGLMLAGATIDWVMFDEPPPNDRVFGEILKRVQFRGGVVWLTMTPINAPIDWIREAAEGTDDTDPLLEDIHARLTLENLEYVDPAGSGTGERHRLADGTECDEAFIEQVIRDTLAHEVPVVVHGEWETRAEGMVFRAFRRVGEDAHVITDYPEEDFTLVLGIDHGKNEGKQSAVLVGVNEDVVVDEKPRVVGLDVDRSDGMTTTREDARAILEMLDRNGLQWSDLTFVYGDRMLGNKQDPDRKSNLDLEKAICRELGLRSPRQLKPRIRTAKRGRHAGAGSLRRGLKWLHELMLHPNMFAVFAECEQLIEPIERWDRDPRSPYKDPIDALRYALHPWIISGRLAVRQSNPTAVLR